MDKRIKQKIAAFLGRAKMLQLRYILPKPRHLILTFHRIRPDGVPPDPFDTCPSVGREMFHQILLYLKEKYEVTPLSYLSRRLESPHPLAAITFDDGWRDVYDVAFPLLQQMKIPATVFMVTGKIGSTEPFWQQILGNAFRAMLVDADALEQTRFPSLIGVDGKIPFSPVLYRKTVDCWKLLSSAERKKKEALLPIRTIPSAKTRYFLNSEEIEIMARGGIEFGTHSVNHEILTREPTSVAAWELENSKLTLEGIIGHKIDMLAYPNGEVSEEVRRIAHELGYRIGCTTRRGALAKKLNLLELPRIDPDWDEMQDDNHQFSPSLFRWGAR